MKKMNKVFVIALVPLLMAIASEPLAQNLPTGQWSEGHEKYHHKFMKMQNQQGTHCCGDGDCSLTQVRRNDSGWEALVEGKWTKMGSTRRVVYDYGIIEPFVCFDKYSKLIWCFSPGGGY